ncbi:hypothetical protein KY331_00320 [Candidatus Woesearchaeota archaeon]|nr:hypothetical protein [Candidatus Woesearchaeota archaeon]
MSTEDKIISIIKTKGPVLPVEVARAIETNILLASAHLSELVSRDRVKISNTKVGGSPVYYLKGQESRLQEFSKNLNNKEQRVYNLLKEKKILSDKDIEPSARVMIRKIKDFAIPFQVNFNDNKILFWKWYLLNEEEVHKEVEKLLYPQKEIEKKKETERIEKEKEKLEKKKIEEEKKKDEQEKQKLQRKLEEERQKIEQEKTRLQKSEQKKIEKQKKLEFEKDDFLNKLKIYFSNRKIAVIENNVLRKGKEIEFRIKIPSVVGEIEYYCQAKTRKGLMMVI